MCELRAALLLRPGAADAGWAAGGGGAGLSARACRYSDFGQLKWMDRGRVFCEAFAVNVKVLAPSVSVCRALLFGAP